MPDDIQAFTSIRLGPGTLYGAITRLVDQRWISAVKTTDRRRQPYRLTAKGRTQLSEQLTNLDRIS